MDVEEVIKLKALSQKTSGLILVLLVLCGCGTQHPPEISRIALLAPFEGRYREIGYDAYYASRLAIGDSGNSSVELLAVDDGGSVNSAVERAKALVKDPLVKAVIALGYAATNEQTQKAFDHLPMLIVGQWESRPTSNHVFMLASGEAEKSLTIAGVISITDAASVTVPLIGNEVFALKQFGQLRPNTDEIKIASSSTLPDEAFRERFLKSGLFVPQPDLLATLTYDAANIALEAMQHKDVHKALESTSYTGINGIIRFEGGYWANAPVHYYCYQRDDVDNAPTLYPC